ncbi:MAG: hypothetical protein MUE34_04035 [Acidimicrobiales bacterium]|nr:hypothetical protein [Acidimicrobiales bacterium]
MAGAAVDVEQDRGGPEDVAGRHELGLDPGGDRAPLPVGQRLELGEGPLGVVGGVERQGGPVLAVPALVGEAGLLLLQMGGVEEEHAAETDGARGGEDRTAEAVADDGRQVPGVVDVGVGQDDGVEAPRRHREGLPVALPQLLEPLEEATVDQDPGPTGVDEEPAARHRAGAAEERDHGGWLHPVDATEQDRPEAGQKDPALKFSTQVDEGSTRPSGLRMRRRDVGPGCRTNSHSGPLVARGDCAAGSGCAARRRPPWRSP